MSDFSVQEANKKLKTYIAGYVITVALTLITYWLITSHSLSMTGAFFTIGAFAALSVFVVVGFFSRMNMSKEDGVWNFIAFVFAVIIVTIIVVGSLWIMYNVMHNMMAHAS